MTTLIYRLSLGRDPASLLPEKPDSLCHSLGNKSQGVVEAHLSNLSNLSLETAFDGISHLLTKMSAFETSFCRSLSLTPSLLFRCLSRKRSGLIICRAFGLATPTDPLTLVLEFLHISFCPFYSVPSSFDQVPFFTSPGAWP
ncbi:hypothetical protein J6590_078944 [Homalodisca vitripennis]|nr:hypothetical protein J6590_078944 [Homalodisca vitripennis]